MTRAFQELFAIDDAFRGISMPGRTDAAILFDAAAAHGIPRDAPDLARFPDVYLRYDDLSDTSRVLAAFTSLKSQVSSLKNGSRDEFGEES